MCALKSLIMSSKFFYNLIVISSFTLFSTLGLSQSSNFSNLEFEKEQVIDKLISKFNSNRSPGFALVVFDKGEIVFRKAVGMADVENQIPIRTNTKFPLSEMSAHFTAFAVMMLAEEGILSLENKIEEYLPEVPDFCKSVKVEDLLRHSSGIDQYDRLKYYAGWTEGDLFLHEDALEMLTLQKELLFEPGTEVLFSETNLVLLAEIISAVSKVSFDQFMKEQVFNPLQMSNTLVATSHSQLIKNVALPYDVDENILKKQAITTYVLGANNVYSTLDDLAKWEKNLYSKSPKLVSAKMIEKMNSVISFKTNGKTITPFDGTTWGQIGYHPERGGFKWYMSGSTGGFSSCVTKIVNKGVTAYALSNSGEPFTTNHVSIVASLNQYPDLFPLPTEIDYSSVNTIKVKSKELEKYCGYFWNASEGYSRKITVENDTLRYVRSDGRTSPLIPLEKDKFQMVIPNSDIQLIINFDLKNGAKFYSKYNYYEEFLFKKIDYKPIDSSKLKEYTGTYVNKDFGVVYNLSNRDDKLILKSLRNGESVLQHVVDDTFSSNMYFFRNVSFDRNDKNSIDGMNINYKGKENLNLKRIAQN